MNITKDHVIIFIFFIIIIFLTYKNNVWYNAYMKCVLVHRARDNYIKKINERL
jgi:hypothetical protein